MEADGVAAQAPLIPLPFLHRSTLLLPYPVLQPTTLLSPYPILQLSTLLFPSPLSLLLRAWTLCSPACATLQSLYLHLEMYVRQEPS